MAAGDGLPDLVTPMNTSEFEAVVAAAKAHFNALKGQSEVIGADLRRLLPRARNVNGRANMMGLDLKLAAIQIGRQWNQAAGALNAAAASVTRAMEIYHGNFVDGGGTHGGGRTFDAGK